MAADSAHSPVNDAATIAHVALGQALPEEVTCHALSFLPLKDLIVATHVCRSWREAALAYPNLWTDISLNGATTPLSRAMSQFGAPWPYPSFLEDLLQRSRSRPVQLDIRRLDEPYLVVCCQAIRRHIHHIRALRIVINVKYFIPSKNLPIFAISSLSSYSKATHAGTLLMAALSTTGPLLEELSVQHSEGLVLPSAFFAQFPKLRTLSLAGWAVSPHVASPATSSVVEVSIGGIETPSIHNLFKHFPNMRELKMIGVGQPLRLPLMGPTDSLQHLTLVPTSDVAWVYIDIGSFVLERIAHAVVTRPPPTVSRDFLDSLGSIETVELNFSDANDKGIQLLARTPDGAMSRELNALCTRSLAEIFDGWATTCLDGVTSAVISDRLPWPNVLGALSAMRNLKTLTFLISARTTKGVFRNQNWDEMGSPLLFADAEASTANLAATCPRLPDLWVLHFKAVDPVLLKTQGMIDPEPDELSLGGLAAHRVSASIVRQLVSCFHRPLDRLIFDGVTLREGSGLEDSAALRSMVKDFVVKLG